MGLDIDIMQAVYFSPLTGKPYTELPEIPKEYRELLNNRGWFWAQFFEEDKFEYTYERFVERLKEKKDNLVFDNDEDEEEQTEYKRLVDLYIQAADFFDVSVSCSYRVNINY